MQDKVTIIIQSEDGKTRSTMRLDHADVEILGDQIRAALKTVEGHNGNLNWIQSAIDAADARNLEVNERADDAESYISESMVAAFTGKYPQTDAELEAGRAAIRSAAKNN